jgi:hypothetical protein
MKARRSARERANEREYQRALKKLDRAEHKRARALAVLLSASQECLSTAGRVRAAWNKARGVEVT